MIPRNLAEGHRAEEELGRRREAEPRGCGGGIGGRQGHEEGRVFTRKPLGLGTVEGHGC